MKSPIILRIFKNNQLVEVKQFDKDQVIIGHEADVNLDSKDPAISPIHCLIELRDSGYYLCDLGSANGTFKNGNQVLDEPISSGDNIGIGSYRIQFFVGVPKPKATPEVTTPTKTSVTAVPEAAKPSIPVVPVAPAPKAKESAPAAPAAPPPKLPDSPKVSAYKASTSASSNKKNKKGNTFAPPSEIKDLRSYLKSSKGPVVEVIVAWKERVLSTHHFTNESVVTIGSSPKAHIEIPSVFMSGVMPFLELTGGCRVLAQGDMAVEVIGPNQNRLSADEILKNGKSVRSGSGQTVRLDQGEIVCISIAGGTLQIFVRYVPATAKPLLLPTLDFTSGELTVLVASLVVVSLLALYVSVYTPTPVADQVEEEQVRLAQFIYNKPPPTPTPKPEPQPTPVMEKVEVKATPTPPPKKVAVDMSKPDTQNKGNPKSQNQVKQVEAAKAAEVAPKPSKVDRPKKFTSTKQGGATKVGDTAGANAQSNKDVSKVGLLSAFGGGGVRKQLDQAYSGSGELLGMANEATGKSGQNENRAGDDIGSKFKDTGAGGKGTATQGIAGVGTKGRGSGMSNYGSGVGLGGKGNVTIDAGGEEEGFVGTIDREAVRRVIRSILNQIRSCYERQLRTDSSLEGKVVIQFEIIDQGRVRTSRAKSSSLNNSAVESCVAARIKEARFPEPPVGTTAVVDYPFLFGAQK